MVDVTHTPGPWALDSGFLVFTAPNGVDLPLIQLFDPSGEAGFCLGDRGEMEANARLISAAPELLKALSALRDELCGVDQWWGKLREAADAADAAITKARGRSDG